MLRITEYIRQTLEGQENRAFPGAILIWNLTNVCNLSCAHCYASAKAAAQEESGTEEIISLIPSLKACGIRFAILSGGEPLIRKDIFEIAQALRSQGILTYLSTNGLLVSEKNIPQIKAHFNYVGISIDGTEEIHDEFRGKKGAFQKSMDSIRLSIASGIRTGIRFTLTRDTAPCLSYIFELAEKEGIPKIYISHLVYAGRGGELKSLHGPECRKAVEFILEKSFSYVEEKKEIDVVTGNNEADAVLLYEEFKKRYPEKAQSFFERLKSWGGNQSGVRLVNIDARGNVKADPFMKEILGSLKQRSFEEIWMGNGILTKLRATPRILKGKCGLCPHLDVCNGNSRARAYAVCGDYFGSDPSCYLEF